MSGGTAQCTADMTVTNLIPASATVVQMLQLTATVDQRRFEDVRPRERGDVHGPRSVVHGRMIITSRPAIVAQQNETETDIPARLIAIKEVAGLQIGIPTATARDLGKATVSGRAIDHAHENTVTHTVEAATALGRVKTATIDRHEIEGHLWQTVGVHGRQNLMIRLNKILRKNLSVLGSPGHQRSRTAAVISTSEFLHCVVLYFVISVNSIDHGIKFWYLVCK